MAEASSLYVCRPTDLAALRGHFDAARGGNAGTVVLEAPMGGGKRALVGELVRGLPTDEDVLVVRAAFSDEEDGLRTVLRLYAALYGALYRDVVLRGKVELILNAQLPQHSRRVQGWVQAFIEGLKKGVPQKEDQSFQVNLPRDNPLVGFVEIVSAIAKKMTTVIDVQNVFNSHSVATFAALEALHASRKDARLLLLMGTETVDDAARAWMPAPWIDWLDRKGDEMVRMKLERWDAGDVTAYAASKGYDVPAAPGRIAEMADGLPGYVAELVDLLHERSRLGEGLEGETLLTLTPRQPDPEELEEEKAPAGENARKHAGVDDADRVYYLGALLGLSFPSGLIADMGGFDRDSIDDLLDATPDLVAEMQFSKGLGTWVYQFKKGTYRKAILDAHHAEEDHEIARRVALFMERFLVPRGYEFIIKTVRTYGEHAATQRAAVLKGMALSADRPDVWAMTQDLIAYYDGNAWPVPMRRVVMVNLLDRLVQQGDPDQAEKLYNDALAFANQHEDRVMEGVVLFAGSRLDYRRNDHYRGRDRARDALKVFTALGDKVKCAEVENHLAVVEFSDGNANAALDHVRRALETADAPQVVANAEYIRGLVAQKARKLPEAAEHFKKANEIAGQVGMGPLALEAGFQYGAALVASGQHTKAADVLARVAQIAQALQNPPRERAAAQLLSQSHAALKNYEAALQLANRTLQLTQQLNFERFLPFDIYAVGFFNLMLGRPTEAVSLFSKARERAPANEPAFLRDLHFHMGIASLRIGEKQTAQQSLTAALPHARATKDWKKLMEANESLAGLAAERQDAAGARVFLQAAIEAADEGGLREERKGLRRKLDEIGG